MNSNECSLCHGRGEIRGIGCGEGGCRPVTMRCELCEGTGSLSDEKVQWVERGEAMRKARVFGKVYRSLSTEAARRGMPIVTLSKMESGIIEPDKELEDEDKSLPDTGEHTDQGLKPGA